MVLELYKHKDHRRKDGKSWRTVGLGGWGKKLRRPLPFPGKASMEMDAAEVAEVHMETWTAA